MRHLLAPWLGLVSLLGAGAAAARPWQAGLFVGSNDGSFGESRLFYADEDARKVYQTFSAYGRLSPQLGLLLVDAERDTLRAGLEELRTRLELVRDGGPATLECVFYYSGHGGPDGLHLGGDVVAYDELYRELKALGCDLLVVVLDACNSGHFLNVKGVRFRPEEFRVRAFGSQRGEVFITSSAEDELAQEQDELHGAVFTYHLVRGLLGAADVNLDGRVTLGEGYAYASQHTIQDTFGTAAGFQAPTFRFDLQGAQDAVLTDLGARPIALEAPAEHPGVYTFLDLDSGIVWGDFEIRPEERALRLPEGRYLVRVRAPGGELFLSRCEVPAPVSGEAWASFEPIRPGEDPIKGQRILHRVSLQASGGVAWSTEGLLLRTVQGAGGLEVRLDNLGWQPLYAGLSLQYTQGERDEAVFGESVRLASWLLAGEALLGLALAPAAFVELSGELRLGGGYAETRRSSPVTVERSAGGFLAAGLQVQAVWWLTRDLGLLLPAVRALLLAYPGGGADWRTGLALGGLAGLRYRF